MSDASKDPVTNALGAMREAGGALNDLLKLAQLEFQMIHALCDRADIPRDANGEKLSAAQRVMVLEQCWRRLLCQYCDVLPGSGSH